MSKGHCLIALTGLLSSSVALSAGCIDAVAEYYKPLTDPSLLDGGADGDGSLPPDCAGDPTKDEALVRHECGVFVSASAAPGGDGSQAKPFQTFADAAAAGARRVYACAGAYTETKQVVFSGGVEVFGGFTDCSKSWTWSAGMQAKIATVADVSGVVLDGGANHIENVSVTAPAATMSGASSIAVLVAGGSLDMVNGTLTAGDAKDGAAGTTTPDDMALDGDPGDPGAGICDSGLSNPGPMGKTKACADGSSSTAGNGGDGGSIMSAMLLPAGTGTDGSAMPAATPIGMNDGKGGTGEGQNAALLCSPGDLGAPGSSGGSGDGASGAGTISKSGYAGAQGKDGTNGKPGQGGGGGGGAEGAKAVTCNSKTLDRVGASGGAGGTGGCGGALGGGGKPGGSSIALVVLDAEVTLASVTLIAGKGGAGGRGGNGQSGGQPGTGGSFGAGKGMAHPSCQGGNGGAGGPGGPGGGGTGGHSLGVAFKGTKAPAGGTFQIDTMKFGKGGAPGANSTATKGQGDDGKAVNCLDFVTGKVCGT
jgi:hypothetical protein